MIGKTILELDRVDSTNAYANRLLSGGPVEEGTIIWAHEQFAGRGQHGHSWISEPGKNLTFTVILKPGFIDPEQQFLLNKAISLGVLDFIRTSLNNISPAGSNTAAHSNSGHPQGISIKWPNDLYIGNKKIGGILIEHKIMGISLETSLAGIGININQIRFSSTLPNPVSLMQIGGKEMDLKEVLPEVCRCLEIRYHALREQGPDNLNRDYQESMLGYGQWRKYVCSGSLMEGKIGGVDNLGRLMVETRSGEIRYFNHGEIEFTYYTSSQT